jgi:hypothetical protein
MSKRSLERELAMVKVKGGRAPPALQLAKPSRPHCRREYRDFTIDWQAA